MPLIWLKPVDISFKFDNCYECPLYKVVSRKGQLTTTGHSSNFIMNIMLPSKSEDDYWIKMGVAMFLSLKY